ncbi:MAG TPA: MATE family efflux transporter [Fontimonas sp.]
MLLRSPELRQELRANLRLALPIIATQITFVGMGTVDTIVAGRYGPGALAGVSVGTNVWFLMFVIFSGVLMACSPIIAQRVGAARDPQETGSFVRATAVFALVLGLLWFTIMQLAVTPVLALMKLSEPAHGYAVQYMRAIAWAALPSCLCFLGRNVAEGHGLPRVALLAGVVGFTINAVLAVALTYGRFGFPQIGPVGCAWATVIATTAMVAVYALRYTREPRLQALQVFRRGWPQWHGEGWEVLRLGLPIAAILAAESWMFNIGALLMGRFGAHVVAAHQVAINFAALSFMVPLAIGYATTVRVGMAVGSGDRGAVRLRGQAGILLGVGYSTISASVMALLPALIVLAYTNEADVAEIAIHFLYFAAVFQIVDCIQATANGALRGIKDTRVPFLLTFLAYWIIGMPLAVWLAFATRQGPYGVWWGFIVALAIAAVGLSSRFLRKTAI